MTYRSLSESLIMATVVQELPYKNSYFFGKNTLDQIAMTKKGVVLCSAMCQKRTVEWIYRNNLFLKQYYWLFVLSAVDNVNKIAKLSLLQNYLRPDSHVFALVTSPADVRVDRTYRVCRFVALGAYSASTIPCETHAIFTESHWKHTLQPSSYLPLQGYDLTLAVLHLPPFSIVARGENQTTVTGYADDVAFLLSNFLGFRYTYRISNSSEYGSFRNGNWSGLIGMVNAKEVDVVAIPLAITPERLNVVEFSAFTSSLSVLAIIRTPSVISTEAADLLTYTNPFPPSVWIAVTALCVLVLLCLFLAVIRNSVVQRKFETSRAWKNTAPYVFWVVVYSIVQVEIALPPKRCIRIIMLCLFIFTLFISMSYASVLTASLTIKKATGVYETMEELLDDGKYRVAVKRSSMEHAAIMNAKTGTFARIREKMLEVSTDEDGIRATYRGNFVYLMPSGLAEHFLKKNCHFTFIRRSLLKTSIHLVMQKLSPYKEAISQKVMSLHSSKTLTRLAGTKYDANIDCPSEEQFEMITIVQCFGALLFWSIGVGISIFALILELSFKRIF